jgi:hypothetical protein
MPLAEKKAVDAPPRTKSRIFSFICVFWQGRTPCFELTIGE